MATKTIIANASSPSSCFRPSVARTKQYAIKAIAAIKQAIPKIAARILVIISTKVPFETERN